MFDIEKRPLTSASHFLFVLPPTCERHWEERYFASMRTLIQVDSGGKMKTFQKMFHLAIFASALSFSQVINFPFVGRASAIARAE
jgi:hypothetical protein